MGINTILHYILKCYLIKVLYHVHSGVNFRLSIEFLQFIICIKRFIKCIKIGDFDAFFCGKNPAKIGKIRAQYKKRATR